MRSQGFVRTRLVKGEILMIFRSKSLKYTHITFVAVSWRLMKSRGVWYQFAVTCESYGLWTDGRRTEVVSSQSMETGKERRKLTLAMISSMWTVVLMRMVVWTSDGLSFQHHAVPKRMTTNDTVVSSIVVTVRRWMARATRSMTNQVTWTMVINLEVTVQ